MMASNYACTEEKKTKFESGRKLLGNKVLSQLYNYYLECRHCDLHIYVEKKSFLAHRCVVTALSLKMANILEHQTLGVTAQLVLDCPAHVMDYLLTYMYTGSVDVSNDDIKDLFHWSKYFEIEELVQAMEYSFKTNKIANLNQKEEKPIEQIKTKNRRKNSNPRKNIYAQSSTLWPQSSSCTITSQVKSDQSSSPRPRSTLADSSDHSNKQDRPELASMENCLLEIPQQEQKQLQEKRHMIEQQIDMLKFFFTSHFQRLGAGSLYGPGALSFFGSAAARIENGSRNSPTATSDTVTIIPTSPSAMEATTSKGVAIPAGPTNSVRPHQRGKKSAKGQNTKEKGRARPASSNWARDENGEIMHGPSRKPMVQCETCGKILADPSSLYRHRKIHNNDRPHSCHVCGKSFIQRCNMKEHMKTHNRNRSINQTPANHETLPNQPKM